MMLVILRRLGSSSITNLNILSLCNGYCSITLPSMNKNEERNDQRVSIDNGCASILRAKYQSLFFWQDKPQLDSCDIKVVDSGTWRVSSGLAHIAKGRDYERELKLVDEVAASDGIVYSPKQTVNALDYDELEDMRIRGNLFYKIDRSSREFEEYKFNFRGKKSSLINNNMWDGNSKENLNCYVATKGQNIRKIKESHQTMKKINNSNVNTFVNEERLTRIIKEKYIVCNLADDELSSVGKKRRTPTFNQLTGIYHEPFCLDIYVSKGSIRACVVHRATSKVVVVAHSISKDMMFDIGSAKSRTTAAAVGKVLAQRALADDIHNVFFTPRKRDKVEGKLQIVLQAIMDNGVNVKVKLKKRNPSKFGKSLH